MDLKHLFYLGTIMSNMVFEEKENNLRGKPVIFFDGYCRLCHSSVNFIMKIDRRRSFFYAFVDDVLKNDVVPFEIHHANSVVLFHNGRYYVKSTAILKILKIIGGVWSLAWALIIIPEPLRNAVYHLIARYRYRWFGKYQNCRIPSSVDEQLFISYQMNRDK